MSLLPPIELHAGRAFYVHGELAMTLHRGCPGIDTRPSVITPGEADRFARLFAAAPDLLAALFGLLNTCELNAPEMEIETQEAINAAVIAIAKAKGSI